MQVFYGAGTGLYSPGDQAEGGPGGGEQRGDQSSNNNLKIYVLLYIFEVNLEPNKKVQCLI